jgi:hypothetical protein
MNSLQKYQPFPFIHARRHGILFIRFLKQSANRSAFPRWVNFLLFLGAAVGYTFPIAYR